MRSSTRPTPADPATTADPATLSGPATPSESATFSASATFSDPATFVGSGESARGELVQSQGPRRWSDGPWSGVSWWDALFVLTVLLCVGLVFQTWPHEASARAGVLITFAVICCGYATLAKRGLVDRRFGLALVVVLVVGAGVATSFSPNTAIFQAIAFPLIWSMSPTIRFAILANVALAVAVATGLVVVLGATVGAFQQAITIEAISLAGSIALGLWMSRIGDLSTERQRLLEELTATQSTLAELNREAGVTSERERLAREIHDTIAQSLTGIVMLSQQAQRELGAHDVDALGERLASLETYAREALVETRTLVTAGAPVELGDGLVPALERLAARYARDTGIAVTCETDEIVGQPGLVSRDSQVVLLRSAQESLANVRNHSGATTARLELRILGETIVLTAVDDGVGFDPHARTTGHGLEGMRDRVALAGGTVEVSTRADAGTRLRVSLPLERPISPPVTDLAPATRADENSAVDAHAELDSAVELDSTMELNSTAEPRSRLDRRASSPNQGRPTEVQQ